MKSFPARSLTLAVTSLALVVGAGSVATAQGHLTVPLQPEGSARVLGMGQAVVALGGDVGSVPYNPASVNTLDPHHEDSLTVAGGARGTDFFAAHSFGVDEAGVPGAVWGAVLNGPGAREEQVAYTVGSSSPEGFGVGGTLRYARWHVGGASTDKFDTDLGLRYAHSNTTFFGLSAINLFHPTILGLFQDDTEVIGAIGFAPQPKVRGEFDYVYTDVHKYARFGAELQVASGVWARTGVSDHDWSLGATATRGSAKLSLAVDFTKTQHVLYAGGISTNF